MTELARRYVVMPLATDAPFDAADPDGAFVLKPWKDPAALRALRAYRDSCFPELGRDLDAWIRAIEAGPTVRGDIGRRNEPFVRAATATVDAPAAPAATRPAGVFKAKPAPPAAVKAVVTTPAAGKARSGKTAAGKTGTAKKRAGKPTSERATTDRTTGRRTAKSGGAPAAKAGARRPAAAKKPAKRRGR